jgi:hypothetical protein
MVEIIEESPIDVPAPKRRLLYENILLKIFEYLEFKQLIKGGLYKASKRLYKRQYFLKNLAMRRVGIIDDRETE